MTGLPIVAGRDNDEWIVASGKNLTQGEFLRCVQVLGEKLPRSKQAIILCHNSRNFLIGFAAAISHEHTVLLPPNQTTAAVLELAEQFPESYCIVDEAGPSQLPCVALNSLSSEFGSTNEIPTVPAEHVAAILFTSGSTGKPQLHKKRWGDLVVGSDRLSQRLDVSEIDYLVATVPPQHMYGLEASVILPMQSGASLCDARPIYLADLRKEVASSSRATTLVTTPIHLQACVRSRINLPKVRRVISATANLSVDLAAACENQMTTEVFEIYGSTETGAVATRRTTAHSHWKCLDGFVLNQQGNISTISDVAAGRSQVIVDMINVSSRQTFELLGRPTDMVKIAGKRASLADLTNRLNAIPGVLDGVVLRRDGPDSKVNRLIALVVAPNLAEDEIIHALAGQIDPAFMPRPVYRIDALPRSETGKLTRETLDKLMSLTRAD